MSDKMDHVTLTKEQLQTLKRFIESRTFTDPVIVMEILDHFACKVEEVMTAQPTLSLEDAMAIAHGSFGTLGFHPLAQSYTYSLRRKYRSIYKRHLKSLLSSFSFIITLLVAGAIFYYAFRWTTIHNYRHLLFSNDVVTFVMIGLLAIKIYYMRSFLLKKNITSSKNNAVKYAASNVSFNSGIFFWFCWFPDFSRFSLSVNLALTTTIFLVIIWLEWGEYLTIKAAKEENATITASYRAMFD